MDTELDLILLYSKAFQIASETFEGKTDKGGQPYFDHCCRVMENLDTEDVELKIIAVLHDVIEDTETTLTELKSAGFTDRIIKAVDLLTHSKEDSYDEYIKKMAVNKDAIKVKLADLKDNCDVSRLKEITDKDIERLKKYIKHYNYLKSL